MCFLQGEVFFFSGKKKISPYAPLKEKERLRVSPKEPRCMRPWFVGVCTRTSWGYAPIRHGLMHPCFTGLRTPTVRTYAPVSYGVTASGFAQRPVFTALRGFPPPEAFVLTST